jgi:mannosyltransferase OCH1-like enzyme
VQLVPRVIWQTWNDIHPGGRRFEALSSMVDVNPEYDYGLFTSEDRARFMCELADADVRRAYEVI